MKKFLNVVFRIKLQACVIFAVSVMVTLFVSLFFPDWQTSEALLWQLMLIAIVGSLLQWFAYSGDVIHHLRYSLRHLVFGPIFLIFLSVCAYFFRWFPVEYFLSWLIFVGIFLFFFFAVSVVFAVYYRVTGQKYDEALNLFKQKKD